MNIFSLIILNSEQRARREALIRLRALSEHQLIDCGISPELLQEGVKAWPWRTPTESAAPLSFKKLSTSSNSLGRKIPEPVADEQDKEQTLDAA